MQPITRVMIKAAHEAGKVVMYHLERMDRVQIKRKGKHDFVTDVDHKVERCLIDILHRAYPKFSILAEEEGELYQDATESDCQWIIDPIDGTTNYIHGYPYFAISIALKEQDQITHAVTYNPVADELFSAVKGRGATLNQKRIRVGTCSDLDDAIIGTGFPVRRPEYTPVQLAMMTDFAPKLAGLRRMGSATLDLAYVACGRLDGFWDMDQKPWDLAAGMLLVQEAGGIIADFSQQKECLMNGEIIAGNSYIYNNISQSVDKKIKENQENIK
jgi:myo-inositol-1(or 4)-monophosphatase